MSRYCTNHQLQQTGGTNGNDSGRANQNPPVYGFDCVCLIKGVLWGWNGNASKTYGGAGYAVNGVPDIGADTMITKCSGVSTDFSKIVPGEAVWLKGHIGVYIGGGKVIECTPAFKKLRTGDRVLEHRRYFRHERAQMDQTREIALYHL